MGLKPLEERKAEFFAAMKRFNQLGTLLPKPESLNVADDAGVAEAEIVLAEMRKVQAELDAMMEYEGKLRDLQPGAQRSASVSSRLPNVRFRG